MDSTTAPRLPPLTGMKRPASNLWSTSSIPSSSPVPHPHAPPVTGGINMSGMPYASNAMPNMSNLPNMGNPISSAGINNNGINSASDLLAADFMAAVVQTPHLTQPQVSMANHAPVLPVSVPMSMPVGNSMPIRRAGLSMDESIQFTTAAEAGARAQREVDSARGTGIFETYELGVQIVQSSKLYANQRRSNRQLPGGSDSTTAACYMLGGTADSLLSPLVARVSPCDPREERCKAVERVLKDKTRGAICSLNGDNPREARADNLAAVRICEVVADILVAYAAKRLLNNMQQLYKSNASKDVTINALRAQVEGLKRRKIDCWCSTNNNNNNTNSITQGKVGLNSSPTSSPDNNNSSNTPGGLGLGIGNIGVGSTRTLAPPPPTFNGNITTTNRNNNSNNSNNINSNNNNNNNHHSHHSNNNNNNMNNHNHHNHSNTGHALPALPSGNSSPPEHHYAGALDAVTAAATQWSHASGGIERK